MKEETVREELGEELQSGLTAAEDVRELSIDELCQVYGGINRNRLLT